MKFKLATMAVAMFGAASAAQAADLGRPAPAAVDYVKVCDAYGAGFFYIPGGDTCLKIGGFVRARAFVGSDNRSSIARGATTGEFIPSTGSYSDSTRSSNTYGSAVAASVTFDARTSTEFGLLRSFIDVRPASGSIDKAYIQLGGLTVGYAGSAFNFHTGGSLETVFEPFWADHSTNLLSYTFNAGNGVSATLSLEDPTTGGQRATGTPGTAAFPSALAGAGVPVGTVTTVTTPTYQQTYGGNRVPDVVANINLTQAWGAAQISVAAHQNYDASTIGGDDWGYAIQGGVKVNLPMLGTGDYIALEGGYTEGAVRYLGLAGLAADYMTTANSAVATDSATGTVTTTVTTTSALAQTQAWSINGTFNHVFTPTVSAAIDAGYADVDQVGANDFTAWRISSSATWTPVNNLGISAGLEYQSIDFSGATKSAYNTAFGGTSALGDASAWVGVLQVKRNF